MIEQIRTALADISHDYRDTRIQHCRVEATALHDRLCALTGTVLDPETLAAVSRSLSARFPAITFNADAVQVLRRSPAKLLTVSTNLAGFHRRPSRREERVSELLNGQVVEGLMEQDSWVYARQADGYLGWSYRPYFAESPPPPATHIVVEPVSLLRCRPEAAAELESRVMVGTSVAVTDITTAQGADVAWAHIVLAGERAGWLPLADLRALNDLPKDENGRRQQMVPDGMRLVGVQYLWGGCTAHGIDCSGLAQLLHKLVGLTIPRDADMQMAAGTPVEPPFRAGDLLFFGSSQGHRSISHVAVSLGGWRVIHSSGPRNGVYVDDVQAVSWLRDAFAGACSYLSDRSMDTVS